MPSLLKTESLDNANSRALISLAIMVYETFIPCSPNILTVHVCSKLKTSLKLVVFTNKVGKNSRYFVGVFNKTKSARRYAPHWLSHAYSKRALFFSIEIVYLHFSDSSRCFNDLPLFLHKTKQIFGN